MTVHAPAGPIARAFWLLWDIVRPPVAIEGEAKFCDWDHGPLISYGDPLPGHGGPLHIDVDAKVFNHGQQVVTVIGVKKATVAGGQQLKPDGLRGFKQVPLEPGGEQKPLEFTLGTVDAAPLSANVGDKLTLTLRVTRCPRAPRARFRLTSPS